MFMNTLGERRLFVNYDKCPQFTKCLERHIYDDNGQPDKKSGFDHMNDAGSYPIAYLFPIRRPISSKTSLSMRN